MRSCRHSLNRRPHGMTLLEVVLALAILAIAMVYLSQLVGIGIRASKEARSITQGQLLAESIVTEYVAGSATETGGTVPTNPAWSYTTQLNATAQEGVMQLVVTLENSEDRLARTITFARLMRDPNLSIPEDEAESTDSSSGTSTGSTGTAQ